MSPYVLKSINSGIRLPTTIDRLHSNKIEPNEEENITN